MNYHSQNISDTKLGEWLEQITALTVEIHRQKDELEALKTTVETIGNIFNYDRTLAYRLFPQGEGMVVAQWRKDRFISPVESFFNPMSDNEYMKKARQGEIIKIEDRENSNFALNYLKKLETVEVKASLVIPIINVFSSDGDLWGFINIHHCQQSYVWAESEIQLLKNIALQISIVIDKIQRSKTHLADNCTSQIFTQPIANEGYYSSVIKEMAEGIVFQDKNGYIIACNKSAERMLGLTKEQMMGRTSFDKRWQAIHEDGSPFPGENHPAMVALKTGKTQSNVIMGVYKPVGEFSWLSINSQPLFNPNSDEIHGVVNSFQDITEKKALETALQESETLFRVIFEQANAGIAIMTTAGKFFKTNQKFTEMVGYTREELKELTFTDITHPDDINLCESYYRGIMSSPQSNTSIDKRYICKNGSIVWVSLTLSPVYNRSGQIQYGLGVSMNISERKAMEQLLEYKTQKERIVYEITRHIHQSLALAEILKTTVADVREFLETDRVIIYQFKKDKEGIVVAESVLPPWSSLLSLEIGDIFFTNNQTNAEGEFINVADIGEANYTPGCINLWESLQIKSLLVVPIVIDKRTWGLLIAHQCRGMRIWETLEEELLSQLSDQLSIAIEQSELHERIKNLALIDGLTGISNRYCFEHDVQLEWQRLTRTNQPLSLILCDIDCFKQYNDTYGHTAGDECLKKVAEAIRRGAKRSSDLVFRYGGEEFVIVLPNTTAENASIVAKRLRDEVAILKILHEGSSVSEYVTLSMGMATLYPSAQTKPIELIDRADRALYEAKHRGRDRYLGYDEFNLS
ncbi:MAG: hypothetical protein N5P05_003993 [Chroococcopsis gigantea SAG 12.99]|jgi:diguanylate cyclase (GGDEF)-like protein/PAS domain S-box-containing protein|nr:hypothetical protein [Chroococcopsis gigantea SAG 12.99]